MGFPDLAYKKFGYKIEKLYPFLLPVHVID